MGVEDVPLGEAELDGALEGYWTGFRTFRFTASELRDILVDLGLVSEIFSYKETAKVITYLKALQEQRAT